MQRNTVNKNILTDLGLIVLSSRNYGRIMMSSWKVDRRKKISEQKETRQKETGQ